MELSFESFGLLELQLWDLWLGILGSGSPAGLAGGTPDPGLAGGTPDPGLAVDPGGTPRGAFHYPLFKDTE